MGSVRAIASALCFLDDIQLRTLVFVDGKKVLWIFKKSINSKTMETTKEEMIMILRELQDLQLWLSNSSHEITLDINFCVFENSTAIYGYVSLFSDIVGMSKSIHLYSMSSYDENRTQLNYFIKYVKKLAKYGRKKGETNQTPT